MAKGDGARGVAEVKGQSVATGFCVPVGLAMADFSQSERVQGMERQKAAVLTRSGCWLNGSVAEHIPELAVERGFP